MIEFRAWPKTPRLNRECVITEKIDGTNAAILILNINEARGATFPNPGDLVNKEITETGQHYWTKAGNDLPGIVVNFLEDDEGLDLMVVAAQSRKRLIAPGKTTDNAGLASWVRAHARELGRALGEGYHYGEWWNAQSARKTLAPGESRFSLFNVERYAAADLTAVPGLDMVPVLFRGLFSTDEVNYQARRLKAAGSVAAPGHPAEGVVVFHTASGQVYKVLCENDELPKGV